MRFPFNTAARGAGSGNPVVYNPVPTVVTAPGNVQLVSSQRTVIVAKTVDEATQITFPVNPVDGERKTIKHGAGNAAQYPVTFVAGAAPAGTTVEVTTLDNSGDALSFLYSASLNRWVLD